LEQFKEEKMNIETILYKCFNEVNCENKRAIKGMFYCIYEIENKPIIFKKSYKFYEQLKLFELKE
jgi:hypothetical protein